MKRVAIWFALAGFTAVLSFAAFPRITSAEPPAATPGAQVVAKGESLGSATVVKLFLTAGGKDVEVKVAEQTDESISFTVPEDIAHGSYSLMVLTGGSAPAYMEQPVRLEVADAETLAAEAKEREELAKELSQPVEPPAEGEQPAAPAEQPK